MKTTNSAPKDKVLKMTSVILLGFCIGVPLFISIYIHPKYENLIVSNAEDDAVLLAEHLISEEIRDKVPLQVKSFGETDHTTLQNVKADFGLYKLKIFSPEGEIVFSTSPEEIGRLNEKDYFHEIVRQGNTFTKVVRKDSKSLEDQVVRLDVVECYVPIVIAGTFSGAFEIYFDITSRFAAIDRLYFKSMALVISLSLVIMVYLIISLSSSGKQLALKEQAERKLAEKETMFRSISSSVNDALITIDPTGHIRFWNKSAQTILGYSAREVLGKELHPLLAPEKYLDAYRKGFASFADTGKGPAVGTTVEMSALRKNGEEIPIELSLASYQAGDGWHAVGTIRDISERKEIEAEREKLISDLQTALRKVKQLSGLLPLCSHCKKVRDDKGYWNQIDAYIDEHSEADISHSICPECAKKHYPDLDLYDE